MAPLVGCSKKENQLYEMAPANHVQDKVSLQMASSLAEDQAAQNWQMIEMFSTHQNWLKNLVDVEMAREKLQI